jgi:hypothetical protein
MREKNAGVWRRGKGSEGGDSEDFEDIEIVVIGGAG